MAVLGVITCEILELEFSHLFSKDTEIDGITVIADKYSLGMIAALEALDIIPSRVPTLREFHPESPDRLEVLVRVLELALHNRKRNLQEGLVKAAKEMGRYVDAIVLGYGLCGNALQKPHELLVDAGVPIYIPMDQDHPVDDCIGLLIGGRECYYKEQCKVAGTFFMIPGWTYHWKRMFEQEFGNMSLEIAKRLFQNYERSLLISTPIMPLEEMRKNSEPFNERFGFRTDVCQGSLGLLKKTWESAKAFVNCKTG